MESRRPQVVVSWAASLVARHERVLASPRDGPDPPTQPWRARALAAAPHRHSTPTRGRELSVYDRATGAA